MNNIETAKAKYTPLEPVRVAVVDGYGDTHSTANIVAVAKGTVETVLYKGHANMCIRAAASIDPQNINIIDAWGGGYPSGRLYDGMLDSLQYNPVCVSTSYDLDSSSMASLPAQMLHGAGVVWVGPSVDKFDVPADLEGYDNILVAVGVRDGALRGAYRPNAIGVDAGSVSEATAKLAGIYAWLKSIKPEAHYTEILSAIHAGADLRAIGGETVKWLNLDRSADLLMGADYVPAPEPEPEPIPEPTLPPEEPMERLSSPHFVKQSIDGLTINFAVSHPNAGEFELQMADYTRSIPWKTVGLYGGDADSIFFTVPQSGEYRFKLRATKEGYQPSSWMFQGAYMFTQEPAEAPQETAEDDLISDADLDPIISISTVYVRRSGATVNTVIL